MAIVSAVALAGCVPSEDAASSVEKWQAAASVFDEARLDAALDKDQVQKSYEEQLKAKMIRDLEADPEVTEAGMVDFVYNSQVSALEALAREYASTRGVRALLTRCDPRTQTDEGYAKTPQVLGTVTEVSKTRAEYRCAMPKSNEYIRAVLEKSGDAWIISRVELPVDLPTWAGDAP